MQLIAESELKETQVHEFCIWDFEFEKSFNIMFTLVLMSSSTVSVSIIFLPERITQSSQSVLDVYCLITSSCIQRRLRMSDTEGCQLFLHGGSRSHGRYIPFLWLSAAELSLIPVSIYIWLAVVCPCLKVFSCSLRSSTWLCAISAGSETLSHCGWTALFL